MESMRANVEKDRERRAVVQQDEGDRGHQMAEAHAAEMGRGKEGRRLPSSMSPDTVFGDMMTTPSSRIVTPTANMPCCRRVICRNSS